MTDHLVIPGFAVLCRIQSANGQSHFASFAVPAKDDSDARAKLTAHLAQDHSETLHIEDSRPLTDAEANGLTTLRPMGPRVPVPEKDV